MYSRFITFRVMILVVDDNPENMLSLRNLLTSHHFPVDTAGSGEEALKKTMLRAYSLIILDVQMPRMDGFEVANAISGFSKAKDTPIIFLFELSADKKIITRGYTSGGTDFITKPVDTDVFLLKVKTFYKISEQTRELKKMQASLRKEVELRRLAQKEQAKSIQELKAVMESLPQIAFTVNKEGRIEYVNEKWYEYSEQKDAFPAQHRDDEPVYRDWEKAFARGQEFISEIRIKKVNASRFRYYLLRITPIKNTGSIIKWVGTFTDIHRQKTLNDILEHRVKQRTKDLVIKNKELSLSNHELQQFAWVASHDLKEPLRKIQTFNYLVKEKYLGQNEEATVYLDRAIRSSKRMSDLIDNLLQYSRLSASPLFEKTDLNVILKEIVSDLEVSILEKKATVQVGCMPEVEAVPSQIRQVFQNLISNALKFSKENTPPLVKISSEYIEQKDLDCHSAPSGPYSRIVISDNGIGFDEKFIDRIFVIFQRLHTRDSYEGTGIGLAITKKIIERHNGLITAKSRENQGTSFILVLPIRNN
jgi:signal transduction histidine kinase/DNA-binding response OmpR family regulator